MGYYDFDNIDYQELERESMLFSQQDWHEFLSEMYDYFGDVPYKNFEPMGYKEKLESLKKVAYKNYRLPEDFKDKLGTDASYHAEIALEKPALLSIMRRWKNMEINEKTEHLNVFVDMMINVLGQDKTNIDIEMRCNPSQVAASAIIGTGKEKDVLRVNKYPFLFDKYGMHELSNTIYHELIHLAQIPDKNKSSDIVNKVIALNCDNFLYSPQELDIMAYYYQPNEQHAYWAGNKFADAVVDIHNKTKYATSKYSKLDVKEIYKSGMIVKSRNADNEYHPYYDFYTAKHYLDVCKFKQNNDFIIGALKLFANSFKYGEFFETPFINGAKEIENLLVRRDINWQDIELGVAKSKAMVSLKYMAKSPVPEVARIAFDTFTRISEFDALNPIAPKKLTPTTIMSTLVHKAKELVNG